MTRLLHNNLKQTAFVTILFCLLGSWAQGQTITSFYPTTATTGTTVTIHGSGFTYSDVQFGGAEASDFQYINDSTILAIVGNGASGNVRLSNGSGDTVSMAGFTYVACNTVPTVTITSNKPSLNCGDTATITATTADAGTNPYYKWYVQNLNSPPLPLLVIQQQPASEGYGDSTYGFKLGNDAASGTVWCTVTSSSTCSVPVTVTSNTIQENGLAPQISNVTITSGFDPCLGGYNFGISYNIDSNSYTANGFGQTWYTPDGTGNPFEITGLNIGDGVYCMITGYAGCNYDNPVGVGGASYTITTQPLVYIPPSSAKIYITASDTVITCGKSVTFTALDSAHVIDSFIAHGYGSFWYYNWYKNGQMVSNNVGLSTYTDSSLTNGDIIYCVTGWNCPHSYDTTTNSITMTVNGNTTPTVSIAATSTTITAGTPVTFTATPTNGGTSPSYQWKKNGSNVGSNSVTYSDAALVNGDIIICVLTSNAACAKSTTATSNAIIMIVNATVQNYVWTGATSTNWNDATNWSNNVLPTSTTPVTIPSAPTNQPLLPTNITVSGLSINGTLNINGKSLTINGAVTGTGSLVGSTTSSLVIGGTVGTIYFSPSGNSLNNLTINGTVSLGNALNLYGTLTSTSGTLNTAGFLTLKSVASGTAVVAPVTGSISGTVTVERYIPQGYASFRDLGVCVSGAGTIANTWGQSLDYYKTYNYLSPNWSAVDSTTSLQPYKGYRELVTGYKNPVAPATSISYMNSDVTLAYSGSLLTGNQSIPLTGGTDKFTFIGNPYASQVDFEALTKSGIYDGYWYLDPTTLYGTYVNYNYYGVNIGASNVYAKSINQYLQPGQAVFVCSNSASPSLTFTEGAKNNGNAQTTIFGASTPLNRIATGLFANGKNVDGAVTVFNPNFSNAIAKEDGLKISNQGENMTFSIAGKDLCANGWNMPSVTDELPLHLYQLKTNTAYNLRLDASQFVGNGLSAYIKDKVLGKQTLLAGDSNIIAFSTTNDTAIYSNRYSIVFGSGTLPVKNINLTATKLAGKEVGVKWNVVGAENIESYTVEHSANGVDFNGLKTVAATISSSYSYIDTKASEGSNYYRIRVTDVTGSISYSKVVSLSITNYELGITVYPNPVTTNNFSLNLGNAPTGKYTISLINKLGQRVYCSILDHNVATSIEVIMLNKQLASGSYTITATGADGKVLSTELIIK